MMIVTGKQMKEIDRTAIEDYKIPGLKLMETAGHYVYEEIIKEIGQDKYKKIVVICGAGNNGGDGYVVARKLKSNFFPVKVYSTVDIKKLSGDAKINYERLIELDVPVSVLDQSNVLDTFIEDVEEAEIIVDAILGTGITREVNKNLRMIFDVINNSSNKILSVDIPSGVGAEDGKIYGIAIKATKTITFQLPKLGCIFYPGAEYIGELVVKDIGIPKEVLKERSSDVFLIDKTLVKQILKPRKKDIHKGDCGKLLVIAGSKGMAGAAALACKSAIRSGVGIVKAAVPSVINDIIQISVPEAISVPLADNKKGQIETSCLNEILNHIKDCNAVAIGPGLGKNEDILKIINTIIKNTDIPLVVDADGLNAVGLNADTIFSLRNSIVITPHPGEMARLTGLDIKHINENRIEIAREYSRKWGIIVLLKGSRTVIALPNGKVYINTSGNPGMASGGSGDVLTGVLSSFLAQKFKIEDAVVAAAFIHGLAGDIMAEKFGEYGLAASDIATGTAVAIKELYGV